MTVLKSIVLFFIAGLCEIGGGWLMWKCLRADWLHHRSPTQYNFREAMQDDSELTEADLKAADAVIAQLRPSLQAQMRDELRKLYASFHARVGANKFSFGLACASHQRP